MRRLLAIAATLLLAAGTPVHAQAEPALPLRDPWVPPEARIRSPEPPSHGAALDAQAVDKLRRRFEAADLPRYGSITRAQAERGGLGFVARHFDAIDRRGSGHVSFDELRRYLDERRRAQ